MQRISFTTLSTPGLDLHAVARLARTYGYDGVDIRVSARAGELALSAGSAQIRTVREALSSEGVSPSGLLGYLSYEDLSAGQVVESLRSQIERLLAIAEELGAPAVRIIGRKTPERSYAPELEASLRMLLNQADADIVMQNHAEGFSAEECLAFAERLDHPRFSLAFCPGNSLSMGEDFDTLLPKLAGRVRKLFVGELKPAGGKQEGVLPGLGEAPERRAYLACGGPEFDGWITFKYERFWDRSLQPPEISLPDFIQKAPEWFEGWKGKA